MNFDGIFTALAATKKSRFIKLPPAAQAAFNIAAAFFIPVCYAFVAIIFIAMIKRSDPRNEKGKEALEKEKAMQEQMWATYERYGIRRDDPRFTHRKARSEQRSFSTQFAFLQKATPEIMNELLSGIKKIFIIGGIVELLTFTVFLLPIPDYRVYLFFPIQFATLVIAVVKAYNFTTQIKNKYDEFVEYQKKDKPC
jgi:hypothetical protein